MSHPPQDLGEKDSNHRQTIAGSEIIMQNYVPVLTNNGRHLAPCHPKRARSLVHAGKARSHHQRGIRCIVLTKTNVPKVKNRSKVQLRIDPGSKHTGIAITRDYPNGSRDALLTLVINHRGKNIMLAMTKRRHLRRGRRHRKTRYRQPRFDNRTRPADWLPPSLLSRLQNTLTWMRRLSKLLPITDIHVETTIFDPQVLRNPDIKGIEYQQGPLYQTNLRAAVFHRDNQKCAYCGKSDKRNRLELDHVVPKSHGGADRYNNLVAACRACNQKRGNQPIEQWLKRRPNKLAEVQAKLGQDLAPATHMNVILPRLLQELRADGCTIVEHSAASTAAGRRLCSVEKSHHADAAMTGCPASVRHLPNDPIVIDAKGRGNGQRIMPNRHGTPKGKIYRRFCRLPRHVQRRTPTPSHKKRAKRVHDVATGDYVRFTHQGSPVHGYGTISHQQVALTKPRWKSIKAEHATTVERNHGYHVFNP